MVQRLPLCLPMQEYKKLFQIGKAHRCAGLDTLRRGTPPGVGTVLPEPHQIGTVAGQHFGWLLLLSIHNPLLTFTDGIPRSAYSGAVTNASRQGVLP